MKKFIIPGIATIIFIAGLISMMLPFIPLGWILIALAALLLAPYLKSMRKFIGWLVKKAGKKAVLLYEWAGDNKRAQELERIIEKNSKNNHYSKIE
jgi:hypothetical protein